MQSQPLDTRATRPKPGDILSGKYRIEGLVGEGGMGSVYAARNLGTGKRVALKWVLAERSADAEMLTRFQREARAAGRIDHPNVVSVYDVGQHGPSTFLVMELLNGYPLTRLLESGPLSQDVAIGLLMPALRGIAAAHAHGVIHRDLKPDNLFLCLAPDGSPRETKVLDFGVSKMTDEIRVGLSVTKTGAVVGTPYYMSPEQVRGMRDIDHRIDVYAMGVILYEMLARRPPFLANNYSALVVEIATGQPPPLGELCPGVDPGLVAVVEQAMARNRDARYPDIESFARALEPFGDGTKFQPDRPDWTSRISTGAGTERQPYRSDDWTGPGTGPRESGVATLPATPLPDLVLPQEETAAPPSGLDASEAVAPVERGMPTLAEAAPGRPWVHVGLIAAAVLAVAAVVALLTSGDGPQVPEVAAEPSQAEPPYAIVDRDEPAAVVAEPPAAEPEEPPTAEPGQVVAAEEVPPPVEAVGRRARKRAGRAATASPAPEATMMEEAMGAMRSPRAGSLSIDDF